ncbi:hypothetical protein [Methylomonas fluvii]|uniref:Uncharacterized protein n=1 Tax=Methylomonas fluvii TaxID=1854564 RepID=A0ABR9DEC5_9GAMM|nr:hypothetical protein [Methylomonas fluvii]MBD9361452.1 hypothetical protein [Methylomonas fluvii]
MSESSSLGGELKQWSKDHWIAIAGILSGVIVGITIPIWQIYWVERSNLSIEINSINREISSDAGIILNDQAELKLLTPYRAGSDSRNIIRLLGKRIGDESITAKKDRLLPDELKDLLSYAKADLNRLPEKIESFRKEIQGIDLISPESITIREISRLNRPLEQEIEVNVEEFYEKKKAIGENKNYFSTIINGFHDAYTQKLKDAEKQYGELQGGIPLAERKIELLAGNLAEKNSYFKLSAILLNSGRSTTSIKRPALLRVYIGEGNYVDLKLKLKDYEKTSEIAEHGTKIANFESDEISRLPEEDQKLINTYWGQSVQALLFMEDISGTVTQSNPIAFSEGLYEKIIYDRLKNQASIIKLK